MNGIFDDIQFTDRKGRKELAVLIRGEWLRRPSQETFDVREPATGDKIASVPLCGEREVAMAIESARDSVDHPDFPSAKRLEVLERAGALVEEHEDELSEVITRESGKPIASAHKEVRTTAERLRLTREEARALYGRYIPGEWVEDTQGKFGIVLRRPVGVVAAISPFNYPLYIGAAKIIPALLAGNSVVAKPASDTPLSLIHFARILQQAGVPAGLLNVVPGKGSVVGKILSGNRHIAALSFTGSTAAGEKLASGAALKKLHLELGGNAAAVVLDDADIGRAAKQICMGTFKNAGQRCDAVSRVLVHEKIRDQFVEAVRNEAGSYRPGNPLDPATTMGPLINQNALDNVRTKVDKALDQGAIAVTGGPSEGLFHPATILDNVSPQMAIAREEIFGPVMPILTVGDDEEAIRIANDSEYGLDACVFTRDLDRAMSVAERLADGSVSINAAPKHGLGHFPFGGNKKSGMGREGLGYSVDELTRLHTIIVART